MYRKLSRMIFVGLVLLFKQISSANSITVSSNKSQQILGYPPIILSIGVAIHQPDFSPEELKDILMVDSIIYIPAENCDTQINTFTVNYFDFEDQDNDLCVISPNSLKWFIIEPKDTDWETIQGWSELNITEITEQRFPGSILSPNLQNNINPVLPALKIPKEAIGKRIGFTYQPITGTGEPYQGDQLYVWDIRYYFGQHLNIKPGYPDGNNKGAKLTRNLSVNDDSIVKDTITIPRIDNLFIEGTFSVGEQLTARYDLFYENRDEFIELTRFWWGESGTTANDMINNIPQGSTSNISPILTEDDVSMVLEVTALPIVQENGLTITGEAVTITTDESSSSIQYPPSIENLELYYASVQSTTAPIYTAKIGDTIYGQYTFISLNQADDNSLYSWGYLGDDTEIRSGNISQSGRTPDYVVAADDIGQVLTLTIEPVDSQGLHGKSEKINSNTLLNYPTISNLVLSDSPDITKMTAATYVFDNQGIDQIQDQSLYQWSAIDSEMNETILTYGIVEESGVIPAINLNESKYYNLLGQQLKITVTAKDQFGRVGDESSEADMIATLTQISAHSTDSANLVTFIPLQLQPTAYFSNGSQMGIPTEGLWKSSHPDVSVSEYGEIYYSSMTDQTQVEITFQSNLFAPYIGEFTAFLTPADLSPLIGSRTENRTIISAERNPSLHIYGEEIWDSIRDPRNNEILAGGPGGLLGGSPDLENTFELNLKENIVDISAIDIFSDHYGSRYLLRDLVWLVDNPEDEIIQKQFIGTYIINKGSNHYNIDIEKAVYGIIVYSSESIGDIKSYIAGLEIIYH